MNQGTQSQVIARQHVRPPVLPPAPRVWARARNGEAGTPTAEEAVADNRAAAEAARNHQQEQARRASGAEPDPEALFDAVYGPGAYKHLRERRLKPHAVKMQGGTLSYQFRQFLGPEEQHYQREPAVDVLDTTTNTQFASSDTALMAQAIAQVAALKQWNAVELSGEPETVAELSRRLRELGVKVVAAQAPGVQAPAAPPVQEVEARRGDPRAAAPAAEDDDDEKPRPVSRGPGMR
jgi:hypothetical protein